MPSFFVNAGYDISFVCWNEKYQNLLIIAIGYVDWLDSMWLEPHTLQMWLTCWLGTVWASFLFSCYCYCFPRFFADCKPQSPWTAMHTHTNTHAYQHKWPFLLSGFCIPLEKALRTSTKGFHEIKKTWPSTKLTLRFCLFMNCLRDRIPQQLPKILLFKQQMKQLLLQMMDMYKRAPSIMDRWVIFHLFSS